MYNRTHWQDEVDQYEDIFIEETSPVTPGGVKHTKFRGTVQQSGTPMNATNFNNMEEGVSDAHIASIEALIAQRQHLWRIQNLEGAIEKVSNQEVGVKVLTNSMKYPFNNSIVTVPLTTVRENLNYVVEVIKVESEGGLPGDIEVSDRQTNGFKMAFDGSATNVTVTYAVIGGFEKGGLPA